MNVKHDYVYPTLNLLIPINVLYCGYRIEILVISTKDFLSSSHLQSQTSIFILPSLKQIRKSFVFSV